MMPAPSPTDKISISLVYPVFNEASCIQQALDHGVSTLQNIGAEWTIIAVNDGSTDDTLRILKEAARKDPRIRILSHETNRGLGQTLRDGFREARGDYILYSDSDLPYDLSILKEALPLLKKYDLIAGYRLNRWEGPKRSLYSWVYNGLVRLLFGIRVRDVNFSFKLFKRDILGKMALKSVGSFIDAELLMKAQRAGFRIGEIGVTYQPRRTGRSKLSSFPVILKILQELWGEWIPHRQETPALTGGWPVRYYRTARLKDWLHVRCRLASAPLEFLERFVPEEGTILDYGCGHGVFSCLLADKSRRRSVHGFDIDERKIEVARKCLGTIPNLSLHSQESAILDVRYSAAALIDVLAYLPNPEKADILRKIDALLLPGGTLLIKEIGTSPAWKFRWTYLQELVTIYLLRATSRKTKDKRLFYEDGEWYRSCLQRMGYSIEEKRLDGHWPYPHLMIVGKKPDETTHCQRG